MDATIKDLVQIIRSSDAVVQLEYNSKQASAMLGISARTLARMRVDGDGPPFVSRNGYHFYRLTDLAKWSLSKQARTKI